MIVVGHAGHIFGLEPETGRVTWSVDLASLDNCSDCASEPVEIEADDSAIVYAACAGHVFRIAVEDGSVHWHSSVRRRGSSKTSLAHLKK
jgi:outer membrane protein assembly factor BamB